MDALSLTGLTNSEGQDSAKKELSSLLEVFITTELGGLKPEVKFCFSWILNFAKNHTIFFSYVQSIVLGKIEGNSFCFK